MGDGNQPPLGFDLGEPDIVTDSYKYYGSINKKHRRGNGITLYADGSILDCKWKSNDQIEIGTPIFLLNSVPETDCADVHYFLISMELKSQCFEYVGTTQLKKAVGYLVAPTHTLYPAYVSGPNPNPTVIDMDDSRLAISDGYLFIYGRLYRRSKNNEYFISRSCFFGNLTNENTAIGIQIDDVFLKYGFFKFDPPKTEFIQGRVYNKDTAEETFVGSSVLEDKSVFWASYQNYKQIQKSNPKKNFKKFVVYQKMPPLKTFQSLKPKFIPLPDDENWSDEEDTIIARAFAKKHSPTK